MCRSLSRTVVLVDLLFGIGGCAQQTASAAGDSAPHLLTLRSILAENNFASNLRSSPLTPRGGVSDLGAEKYASRRLQEQDTCDEGAAFSISSVVFPALAGCYTFSDTSEFYIDETLANSVSSFALDHETSGELSWYVFHMANDSVPGDETAFYCTSFEGANVVHPADTSWYCDFERTGRFIQVEDDDDFSVTCDCTDALFTTTAAPSVTPMIEGTSGSTETLCVENDPFTITAPEFSSLEGCFVATNQTVQGETVYSTTGVYEAGAVMVDAYRFFLDERELAWNIFSLQAESAEDNSTSVYCYSANLADRTHPAYVTWQCDFDDVSDYDLVTDDQLSVSCGCTEFPPFVASSSSSDSTNSSAGLPAPTWPYLLLSAVAAFAHAMMRL